MNHRRAGFSLVELLVSLVVTAVVAGGMLRLMMGEIAFAEDREAWRTARQASRSAMTVLASDLRMVETANGIEAAASGGQDLTVRVPYAFGVLCATDGSVSTVALLPTDSAMFAQSGHSGFAYRTESTGAYTYVPSGTVTTGASASPCTTTAIAVIPGGEIVTLGGAVPVGLAQGSVVLLYRRIRYEIKASAAMPGLVAFWRTRAETGEAEEIAAPFDAGARFRFYQATSSAPQDAVPTPLRNITGLELAFDGRSERTPRKASGPKVVQFSASLFFQNQP